MMRHMVGIEQRDKHVHIEEGAHSVGVVAAQLVELLVGHEPARRGEWLEPVDGGWEPASADSHPPPFVHERCVRSVPRVLRELW
jgi:hypothetical protein